MHFQLEPSITLCRELHSLIRLGQKKTSSLKCKCFIFISYWRVLPAYSRHPRPVCFTTVLTRHSGKIFCFRKWKAVREVSAWVKHCGNRTFLLQTDFCFPHLDVDRNLVLGTGWGKKFLSSENSLMENLFCRMKQQYEIKWS